MKIEIPKGTTFRAVILLTYEDGTPYTYTSGDVMRFGVKAEDLSGSLLIEKTLSYDSGEGGFVLELAPSDTAELSFGTYLYDIGLESGNDYFMAVECDEFIVGRAVTQMSSGGE